jgi:hypothetical protein
MAVIETYTCLKLTCVDLGLEAAVDLVREQLKRPVWGKRWFQEWRAPLELGAIYGEKPPPLRTPRKVAVFSPGSSTDKAVLFSNLQDGWHTLASCVSGRSSKKVCCFALSGDVVSPRRYFEVWENGIVRRHVSVLKDDRWVFWETGDPLACEDLSQYKKRRIPARVSWEYVVRVARALGYEIDQGGFWSPVADAVYFEERC